MNTFFICSKCNQLELEGGASKCARPNLGDPFKVVKSRKSRSKLDVIRPQKQVVALKVVTGGKVK